MRKLWLTTIILVLLLVIILIPRVKLVHYWTAQPENEFRHLENYDLFKTEIYLTENRLSKDTILVHFNFRDIKSDLVVESLEIRFDGGDLVKVCSFEATDYSVIDYYQNVNSMPIDLRTISNNTEEYHSFRHEFALTKRESGIFKLVISGLIQRGDKLTQIAEKQTFKRSSSLKLVPTDNHSDFIYLLIWPLIVVLGIFVVAIIIKLIKKKPTAQ